MAEIAILCIFVVLLLNVKVSYSDVTAAIDDGVDNNDSEPSSSISLSDVLSSYSYSEESDYNEISENTVESVGLKRLYNAESRSDIFGQLDINKDNTVTKEEYIKMNKDIEQNMVDVLFGTFDVDNDGTISKKEFNERENQMEQMDDCKTFAIEQCDETMAAAIENSYHSSHTEEMCFAIQTYVDCVYKEASYCDLREYLRAVYHWADSYKKTELCPDLRITHQIPDLVVQSLLRDRRSIVQGMENRDGGSPNCASQKLFDCSVEFNRSLKATADFCTTLDEYRHCITHAFKQCNDENLYLLRESLKLLARQHRKFEVCEPTDQHSDRAEDQK